VTLRARNDWVRQANEDDDASSTELPIAVSTAATLVEKQEGKTTAKKNMENRQARVQGIKDRLIVIRA